MLTEIKNDERLKCIPVVVLTGLDDKTMGAQTVRKCAQDYLNKGRVDDNLLARAINYAIARSQLERQLRQSQKMEAVGRLAGGVAHEVFPSEGLNPRVLLT